MQGIKNKIFYLACLGFGAGVLWRSFFNIDIYPVIIAGLTSIILILFFSLTLRNNRVVLISVFALAVSLGILRFHLADKPAPEIFEYQTGQRISLSGIVIDEPDKRENSIKLTVKTEIDGMHTKIVLSVKNDNNYRYGDEIYFTGKLEKPKNFLIDQGKEFDYVNYLRKDDIFYTIQNPKIDIISHSHGNFIKGALYSIKETFDEKIALAIPAPENTLMGALILGGTLVFGPAVTAGVCKYRNDTYCNHLRLSRNSCR